MKTISKIISKPAKASVLIVIVSYEVYILVFILFLYDTNKNHGIQKLF